MNTCFSQMIGVAVPSPGILTFHFRLLVSLQVMGGLAAGATPLWRGPRHWGQFWSAEAARVVIVEMVRNSAGRYSRLVWSFIWFPLALYPAKAMVCRGECSISQPEEFGRRPNRAIRIRPIQNRPGH